MKFLYLPFILQGLSMFVDEFYFHEKRGLPKWESIGHPLDTLTVLSCYGYLLWGNGSTVFYVILCSLSCLFITKDEFVHRQQCSPVEHWLHSLLFILHPVSFLAAYLLMERGESGILQIQFVVIGLFMIYQTFRWSSVWRMRA